MLVRDGLVGRQSRPRIVRELELGNSNGRKSEEETAGHSAPGGEEKEEEEEEQPDGDVASRTSVRSRLTGFGAMWTLQPFSIGCPLTNVCLRIKRSTSSKPMELSTKTARVSNTIGAASATGQTM